MREELMDRFGEVPKSVENLLRISLIRVKAHGIYVTEIKGKQEKIQVYLKDDAPIQVENIPLVLERYVKKATFTPKGTPCFTFRYKRPDLVEKAAEQLLALTEEILQNMEELLIH